MTIDEEVIVLWFPPESTLDKPLNLGPVSLLTKKKVVTLGCFQLNV